MVDWNERFTWINLEDHILKRAEFEDVGIKTILHAREEGLALLKDHVNKELIG